VRELQIRSPVAVFKVDPLEFHIHFHLVALLLSSPIWSRIDRFLVSPNCEAWFPVVSQKWLSRLYSDHFPILLDCGDVSRASRPFKFENMWLKAKGFVGLVK